MQWPECDAVCRLLLLLPFLCVSSLQVLVYGDCAVNVAPSSADLASIAECSADTAAAFGIEPRVAMLSYSTMGSGAGPDVSAHLAVVECAVPCCAVCWMVCCAGGAD